MPQLEQVGGGLRVNAGALIIRIGFGGVLYYNYNKDNKEPQNSIGNYYGPYSKSSGLRVDGLIRVCIMGLWVQRYVVGLHLVRAFNGFRVYGVGFRFSI